MVPNGSGVLFLDFICELQHDFKLDVVYVKFNNDKNIVLAPQAVWSVLCWRSVKLNLTQERNIIT